MASIYARPKNGAPAVVHKAVALIAGVLMLAGMGCAAHPVGQPISQDRVLSDGWRFVRQDVAGAQAPLLDDSHWQSVDLPHTYNALDGQDGGDNYYRGPAWYRLHLPLGSEIDGRQVYLRFEGAALMAQVYVNGQKAGEHRGAFAAFCFNITPLVHRGDNVIAVRVDNAKSPDVPPLVGDFNICGGLYRNVHLLTLNPLCISPTDDASPGVYLTPVQVDSDSATVQVTVELRNDLGRSRSVAVRCSIADAGGRQVAAGTAQQSIPARGTAEARTTLVVRQPHLWNGRDDPYLYRAIVELADGGRTVDLVDQPLGLRHFRVDPNSGFYLNGRSYPLHGVCVHQDYLDRGWAIRPAEIERNYSFIDDIGCTAVRLAHYQHPEYEYALCDRKGIAVWAELALVNDITDSTAFSENAAQQLRELIKQNYNHPSIFFWSLYNELGPRTRTDWPLVSRLNELAHRLDPHRLTVAASHLPTWHPVVWVPDITAFNRYFYAQIGKEGAIVDERFNGGGSVADYYLDWLRKPLVAYWAMRYGADLRTPTATIQGPKVMLINESAGSGGDLLPWMWRKFGVGKLVGTRTWGGLVGILGFPLLMDGGMVTAPNLAIWTEDGFVVENEGVPPDIEVEQTPKDVIAGHDPQLERAIQVVMEELAKNPPKKPKRPAFPIRVK